MARKFIIVQLNDLDRRVDRLEEHLNRLEENLELTRRELRELRHEMKSSTSWRIPEISCVDLMCVLMALGFMYAIIFK